MSRSRPHFALAALAAVLLASWVWPALVMAQTPGDTFRDFPWGASRRDLPVKPERWIRPGKATQHMIGLATLGLIAPDIHTRYLFYALDGDERRAGRLRCLGLSYGFTQGADEQFVAVNAIFSVVIPAADILANAVDLLGTAYTRPAAGCVLWDTPEFKALLNNNALFILRKPEALRVVQPNVNAEAARLARFSAAPANQGSEPAPATAMAKKTDDAGVPGPGVPSPVKAEPGNPALPAPKPATPEPSQPASTTQRSIPPSPSPTRPHQADGPALRRAITHATAPPASPDATPATVATSASVQPQTLPGSFRAPVRQPAN